MCPCPRLLPLLLLLGACSAGLDAGDTSADTSAESGCPVLTFDPAELELGPASSAEVTAAGCASGFSGTCPGWASLFMPDPVAAGDVVTVSTLPGWSGPLDGSCVVSWDGGEAELLLHLVTR
jgi:hypothetical protein